MKLLPFVRQVCWRWRYPNTLPEEIFDVLGLQIMPKISFEELLKTLTDSDCCPGRLFRFMPREKAERVFRLAQQKEFFPNETLFSYYFSEGWLEFVLRFDDESRLRRLYVQHGNLPGDSGMEIILAAALK
ncbi:hypothetical protein JYU14_03635 [Simkania negevensis]|uniref:Uncharacterized protein n=1 Tax=Simkania negevensis TaxID=83561 RepID=A0ABS3AQZ3_9BACT|nr:hypothetical protein [Simkania negevensis]